MSRASSNALKHPPVTAPSEPAGATSPFPELAVAIERQRRRGRGAQSNDSGRFEAEARVAFDDGWQSLEDRPSTPLAFGRHGVRLAAKDFDGRLVADFTIYLVDTAQWEGRDHHVRLAQPGI